MNDPQVVVNQSFINAVRSMLVGMAFQGVLPTQTVNEKIDKPRQFCEGYLGIRRERIRQLNPNEISEVMEVCGLPIIE